MIQGKFVHVKLSIIVFSQLLAHEWGHLRYGVFDEYAYSDEPQFYLNTDNQYEGTRCSKAITGPINNHIWLL